MTSDLLVSVAGVVLSLLFSYLPGLSAWYGELAGDKKRLIMLCMLALVAGGMFALDCGGLLVKIAPDVAGMCTAADGWVQVVRAFVLAMIANQSAYAISPK
jgi:hypothetical protein